MSDNDYVLGLPPAFLPSHLPAPETRSPAPDGLAIEELDLANKADRQRFMGLGDSLYHGVVNYIAPMRMTLNKVLDPNQHPVFEHMRMRAFVARQNGRDVARLEAHIDSAYNAKQGVETGFFGFFESIDDRAVAHALFDKAIAWLKNEGCVEVIGPAQYNMSHSAGLLVENFDRPPFVDETYNHPYYEALITSYGFGKAKDMLIWWMDTKDGLNTPNRKRFVRIADRVVKRENVSFRHADMKQADRDLALIRDLYVQGWDANWGFAPITEKEWMWSMEDFKLFALPKLILFVMVNGREVGFATTVPNVNQVMPKNGKLFPFGWVGVVNGILRKPFTEARLYALGVLPEFRKRGLEAVLITETVRRAAEAGITQGEAGWTLEDNALINQAIEKMDGKIDRRYRIYGMKLA